MSSALRREWRRCSTKDNKRFTPNFSEVFAYVLTHTFKGEHVGSPVAAALGVAKARKSACYLKFTKPVVP
jgi:hypothetical protein